MSFKLMILPGDGIGNDVTREAVKVIKAVEQRFGFDIRFDEGIIGGASLDRFNLPVKPDVLEKCKDADAVFLGAIGGPKWDDYPSEIRPEKALLALRKTLETYINYRPVQVKSCLKDSSPLKPELLDNVDILIVRELTGGLYFGKPQYIKSDETGEYAVDTMAYTASEIERIAVAGFEAAKNRRKKVTSVDKMNILSTSQLWRKVVLRVAGSYPEIELNHMLVDNCAMQLIRYPAQFDVIVTENTFGDILSDEAAMISGSLGMLASASLGDRTGLYEPVHGSAPDIEGKNLANPIAAINSAALMFRFSMKNEKAALAVERAVDKVLEDGYRTKDIAQPGTMVVGTTEMGDLIADTVINS